MPYPSSPAQGGEDVKTRRLIESEADFPALVMAPDGVMRHPISVNLLQAIDTPVLNLSNPFWLLDDNGTFLSAHRFSGVVNCIVNYTGTDSLFYCESMSYFSLGSIVWQASVPGTKLFDIQAATSLATISVIEVSTSTFIGFAMGDLINIDAIKFEFVAITPLDTLHINGSDILIAFRDVTPDTSFVGAINKPAYLFTGNISNITIDNNKPNLNAGDSFLAIDSSAVIDSEANIVNNAYPTTAPYDFFEPDLTGSITQFEDLSGIITGTVSTYESDGVGNVKVTSNDNIDDVYIGLNVIHTSTAYNGTFQVIKKLGINSYVMNAVYTSDDTNGSYVASGTRVTTSSAHGFNSFRGVDVSGTTNYNGTEIAYNAIGSQFDINTPFVADDATGAWLVSSLNQTDNTVFAANTNGSLPASEKRISAFFSANTNVTAVTDGVYSPLNLSNLAVVSEERFELVDAAEGEFRVTSLDGASGSCRATLRISGGFTGSYRLALGINGATPAPGATNFKQIDIFVNPVTPTLEFPFDLGLNDTFQVYIAGDGTGTDVTITGGDFIISA